MSIPTSDDVNKAREQASNALGDAFEQARTPLLAALGAGDLAANALVDTLNRIREQADSTYDPVELRKRIDAYSESAARLYGYLAERGEETLGRLRAQPEVQVVRERADEAQKVADDVLGTATRSNREGSKTQRSSAQSTKSESAKTAGTKTGSTKTEATKTEATKSGPKTDSTRTTAAKNESAKGGAKAGK